MTKTIKLPGHVAYVSSDVDFYSLDDLLSEHTELYCFDRRYSLGHEKLRSTTLLDCMTKINQDLELGLDVEELNFDEFVQELQSRLDYSTPLWLYEHSGVSLHYNRTCQWDSRPVGFALISPAQVEKYGLEPEVLRTIFDHDLRSYARYLSGDLLTVALYRVVDGEEQHEVSSGPYLSEADAMQEVRELISAYSEGQEDGS